MRFIIFALLLFFPVAAQACYVAPQWATEEHMQKIPETYVGFQVEILSLTPPDETSTPHESFTATAKVLKDYSNDADTNEITLMFDHCSVVPEAGKTYYFIAQRNKDTGHYDVNDQPEYLVHPVSQSR